MVDITTTLKDTIDANEFPGQDDFALTLAPAFCSSGMDSEEFMKQR